MSPGWRALVIGLAVVVAAVLGGAAGAGVGATLGSLQTPDPGGLDALTFGVVGVFIGAALGAFVELAAVFKLPRVAADSWLPRLLAALVVVGIAAIGVGYATEGALVIAPLFMACLPLGLLGVLAAVTQRIYPPPP